MLITRPDHDIVTNYLFYWSTFIITQAFKSGKNVTDLSKNRANAKEFASVIRKTKPKMIVINGHGSDSVVRGYDNEPLVEKGKNQDLFKGAIVFSRSCQSAKNLGPEAIKIGCKAYIGYDDDFVFVTETAMTTKPLEDKTAQLFLEPSNYVVISLLKGHSPTDANKRSKDFYKKTIKRLMSSVATSKDIELIPNLFWDYSHQVCLE